MTTTATCHLKTSGSRPIWLALVVSLATLATLITGCGEKATTGTETANRVDPASLMPADPDLAQTYLQSCFACHARSMSGAPVTGDKDAWASRMAKGMDTLVKNAINGYRGMPPLGGCMDCDRQEFADLIAFMAASSPKGAENENSATPSPAAVPTQSRSPDAPAIPQ